MINFYQISRFKSIDETFYTNWENITNFPNEFINEYLQTENEFILTLKEFIDFFCRKRKEESGFSTLAYNIIVENFCNIKKYNGIEQDYLMLMALSEKHINHLDDVQTYALVKYWIRGLCSLYFCDTASNSFLYPKEHEFYFYLGLSDVHEIPEIFNYRELVYFSIDMDHKNYSDDYEAPENIHENIIW